MKKYRYNGSIDVHLAMIGDVKAGQTISTDETINHPDFSEVKEDKKEEPKVVTK